MFSLPELKTIYRDNRKLINAFGIMIILLVIVLTIVLIASPSAVTENSKLGTVEPAKVADSELNDSELSELHDVIKKTYGEKIDGYEIADGELLEDDGSWYATTFSKPTDQWSLAEDTYRIILHKVDGSWQIVAGPELVFSYLEYPDIPKSVIFSANNL